MNHSHTIDIVFCFNEKFKALFFFKNSQPLRNLKGQATLEYVLLMAVVVLILMIAMGKLYTPLREWTKYQVGSYVYCLLDQGKLPSLGGGSSGLELGDECTPPDFKSLSQSPSQSKWNNSESQKNREKENQKKSRSDSMISGRNKGDHERRSMVSNQGKPFVSSDKLGTDRNLQPQKETTPSSEESKNKKMSSRFSRSTSSLTNPGIKKIILLDPPGALKNLLKREEERTGQKSMAISKFESPEKNRAIKKFTFKPKEKSSSFQDDRTTEFGIWKYFRYFVVIAILIALILFMAGQARQIFKNME